MSRIAIFGGTFDPIHIGHLRIAAGVIDRNLADDILFMPAFIPPHKEGRAITDANIRHRMIEAAISGADHLAVSDYEIRKGTTSFTVETLDHFRVTHPHDEISFIMGGDSAFEIASWKDYERLLRDYPTIVIGRPGIDHSVFVALIERLGFMRESPFHYSAGSGRSITFVDDIRIDISASRIRGMVGRGDDASALIPPAALSIVLSEKLYR